METTRQPNCQLYLPGHGIHQAPASSGSGEGLCIPTGHKPGANHALYSFIYYWIRNSSAPGFLEIEHPLLLALRDLPDEFDDCDASRSQTVTNPTRDLLSQHSQYTSSVGLRSTGGGPSKSFPNYKAPPSPQLSPILPKPSNFFSRGIAAMKNRTDAAKAVSEQKPQEKSVLMTNTKAFENASTSVAASQMRNALNNLADTVPEGDQKKVRKSMVTT